MKNLQIDLLSNQLIDDILKPCVTDFLSHCDSSNAVTLKDIYGIGFWLKLSDIEKRQFGYRFRCICQSLGFKYTLVKRNKANLYILIN